MPSLTVRQNVMLGAHHRHRSGFAAAALHLLSLADPRDAATGQTGETDDGSERVSARESEP